MKCRIYWKGEEGVGATREKIYVTHPIKYKDSHFAVASRVSPFGVGRLVTTAHNRSRELFYRTSFFYRSSAKTEILSGA